MIIHAHACEYIAYKYFYICAKFKDLFNFYVNFAGYKLLCVFSVISKNKLSRRELNRQIYDSAEIFLISSRLFDKSFEIVNHVESQRYRKFFFCDGRYCDDKAYTALRLATIDFGNAYNSEVHALT